MNGESTAATRRTAATQSVAALALRALRAGLAPAGLLAVWWLLSRQSDAYAFVFVPFERIWAVLAQTLADGSLLHQLQATARRACLGLSVGVAGGIVLGGAMALSPWTGRLIGPLFHALRQVPLLGWVPLFGLWFGTGLLSQALVISLAALFPVTMHTYQGLHGVDVRLREVGRVLMFDRLQFLRLVLLPAAAPDVLIGLTQAIAAAWLTAVGVELLFNSGAGLGNLMTVAENSGRMEILVVCVFTVACVAYGTNQLARFVGDRLAGDRARR